MTDDDFNAGKLPHSATDTLVSLPAMLDADAALPFAKHRPSRSALASDQLVAHCTTVHTLEEFERVLMDATRMRAELRIRPFAALATAIEQLDKMRRCAACVHLLRAVKQLPSADRPDLLIALCLQTRLLPEADRPALLRHIYAASRRFPSRERLSTLRAMGEQSVHLLQKDRKLSWDRLLITATELQPEHGAALLCVTASTLHGLPPSRIHPRLERIFAVLGTLPAEHRRHPLEALLHTMHRLRPMDQLATHEMLNRMLPSLPEDSRDALRTALRAEMIHLPETVRSTIALRAGFAD